MSFRVSRRTLFGTLLGSVSLGLAGKLLANEPSPAPAVKHKATARPDEFVKTDGIRFTLKNKPYSFVGTNIWYGAYLGSTESYGNRPRLVKELDNLASLGINNLRVLGSSELSPLKNSLSPAFTVKPGLYNESLLVGLDFLLAEMGRRHMKAVVYLNNFWEWSGGMVTYLYWTNGGSFINLNDPAHPWPEFAEFSAQFYSSDLAKALYWGYVRTLVNRTNTITGKPYKDDPAIMAWQLSNEPRAGEATALANGPAYLGWIADSAALIRSQDPNHLVSLGQEGLMGMAGHEKLLIDAHEHVDYVTAHIWPQNWGWLDPKDIPGTFDTTAAKVKTYIDAHAAIARGIDKPLVFEEFGAPRDDAAACQPGSPATYRDRMFGQIFAAVEDGIRQNTPVAGSNFWAWGGYGRAQHADHVMLPGETAYVGDPPQEPQGLNSVFDIDDSTIALIKSHGARLKALTRATL
jgi:mannan endo-1,4-beta-mannosidase